MGAGRGRVKGWRNKEGIQRFLVVNKVSRKKNSLRTRDLKKIGRRNCITVKSLLKHAAG